MTHPTDLLSHPRAESCQCLHTQESGDAGLSSNMEHKFSDNYTIRATSVRDKGSNVKPIPKGEQDIFHCTEGKGKVWSHPSVSWYVVGPKFESPNITAEEGFLKSSTAAATQEISPPPAPPTQNNPEKETDEVNPDTTALPRDELVGDVRCTTDAVIYTRGKPEKPKALRQLPRERRRSNRHRKRPAGRNRKMNLLCWMAVSFIFVPVTDGFPGAQRAAGQKTKCYICMDKDRCPKLSNIYDSGNTFLYGATFNQTFPGCSGVTPPGEKKCVVCDDQNNLKIICSEDVGRLEVEHSDGGTIEDISPNCVQEHFYNAHYGLFAAGLFLLVVAALGIFAACRWRNRAQSSQQ
ncbi:uncharacterized protein LOC119005907 isoform X1 [Acanthopagrus latus]|uniref:uncharacterized protein LOC119005907 isoform X1 n=2 Tax=Acanthopagrus latus TaxID=8177 RepID=UPI00187CD82C|nr:uncharacterized protein LOC119005907 isoform X1 [Acanthopagrus latus]